MQIQFPDKKLERFECPKDKDKMHKWPSIKIGSGDEFELNCLNCQAKGKIVIQMYWWDEDEGAYFGC